MTNALTERCAANGIVPRYVAIDGVERDVSDETLERLLDVFGLDGSAGVSPPSGIEEALAEPAPSRCYVPEALGSARCWGLTCQLPSLASSRNLGMGDFADLAALCRLAAEQGADFVGTNPIHAPFWSRPEDISPFSPSNRRFLNARYIALEWVPGFEGLTDREALEARQLRELPLIEAGGVARLKDNVLRRLFAHFPWSSESKEDFLRFCERGGAQLAGHALFEAISEVMVAEGHHAGWPSWPEALQQRGSPEVAAFASTHREAVHYHLWLQWQAEVQVARVQREALAAGMRIGLYLDFAVGASPDGSATWYEPDLTVPGVSIGAPPDGFNAEGQDWGLAPLSPTTLAQRDCGPVTNVLATVMRHAGALRIDHAMSLARLWLIPRGLHATEGAYVHYPLSRFLERLAEVSNAHKCLIIGEDLGLVPNDFRPLMAQREIHGYKVFFYERDANGFVDTVYWPTGALACLATHDTPTFTGWWRGSDLDMCQRIGLLGEEEAEHARQARAYDREAVLARVGHADTETEVSLRLHSYVADSPCRLAALQIEDALGVEEQINVPGTTGEYPNWRRRLPVSLDAIAEHPLFLAHCEVMRLARPR